MQVNCTKCSQPIALADIIESSEGHLSHVDCKRPKVLTSEERALVYIYCSGHVVAHCPVCDVSYRSNELAADILGGGRTNMCPRCRQDLTEAVRAPLFRCPMLPKEIQLKTQAVRAATQHLVKQSREAIDHSDVLLREAEARLFERQRALRAPCRGEQPDLAAVHNSDVVSPVRPSQSSGGSGRLSARA